MKNKGFTLAEILIAMIIVGIIAAIVIPLIRRTAPNANRLLYKKSYVTAERAISALLDDRNNYPAYSDGSPNLTTDVNAGASGLAATTIIPSGEMWLNNTNPVNLKTTLGVTMSANMTKFSYLFARKFSIVGVPDYSLGQGWVRFTTPDGVVWTAYSGTSTGACAGQGPFPVTTGNCAYQNKIFIDVNGPGTEREHQPNCTADSGSGGYWSSIVNYSAACTNPDQFIIGVRYDGKLQAGCSTLPVCNAPTDALAVQYLQQQTNNN